MQLAERMDICPFQAITGAHSQIHFINAKFSKTGTVRYDCFVDAQLLQRFQNADLFGLLAERNSSIRYIHGNVGTANLLL